MKRTLARIVSLDERSLALLRIGLALLLLADLAVRASDLRAHYTADGILSAVDWVRLNADSPFPVLHLAGDAVWFQALLFALHALAALALLVGYRTPSATLVCWFLLTSLHLRNQMVLNGGDHLLRSVLFWSCFLPLGAVWSLDSQVPPRRVAPPKTVVSLAGIAYVLQMVLLYAATAVHKLHPDWTTDRTALYYALNIDHFTTRLGKMLLDYPDLLPLLTGLVFCAEAAAPILLLLPFPRMRVVTLAALAVMHLSFGAGLRIGIFAWSPIVCLLGLIPSQAWSAWPRPAWAQSLNEKASRFNAKLGRRERPRPFQAPVLVTAALLLMLALNVYNLRAPNEQPPRPVAFAARLLGMLQSWNMFAPYPPREDGWIVVEARTRQGDTLDPSRNGKPVDWTKPELVSATYKNQRWRRYLLTALLPRYEEYLRLYLEYLVKEWNRSHADQVVRATLYYMRETTLPDGRESPPEKLFMVEVTP